MMTFLQLSETMDHHQKKDKALEVIKIGLNFRPDFWEDFIRITASSDSLGELLGVSKEKISSWSSKISSALEKVSTNPEEVADRFKTIKTGQK